jgi:hypothetical protein
VGIFRVSIYDSGYLSVRNFRVGFRRLGFCHGTGLLAISCEHRVEPSGFMKDISCFIERLLASEEALSSTETQRT